jgi:hypothetical protein
MLKDTMIIKIVEKTLQSKIDVFDEEDVFYLFTNTRVSTVDDIKSGHSYCIVPNISLSYMLNAIVSDHGSKYNKLLIVGDSIISNSRLIDIVKEFEIKENVLCGVPVIRLEGRDMIYSVGYCFSKAIPKLYMHGLSKLPDRYDALSPTLECSIYNLRLLENLGGFDKSYMYAYMEIDLSIRGKRAGLITTSLGEVYSNHYDCSDRLYWPDIQRLYDNFSIGYIDTLNNSNINERQNKCFHVYQSIGNKIGTALFVLLGDDDVSYYRLYNRIHALSGLGWQITVCNSVTTNMLKDNDVIVCQYVPTISDNILMNLVLPAHSNKTIVDVSDDYSNGHPTAKRAFDSFIKTMNTKYSNVPIISPIPNSTVYDDSVQLAMFNDLSHYNRDGVHIGIYGSDVGKVNLNELK